MTLALHTIAPAKGAKKGKTRVGRGYGSGKGKTAGRGTKGQRARTGGRSGLKLKGMKQMVLGFPKTRGFKSGKPDVFSVRIGRVAAAFAQGGTVTIAALKREGLVPKRALYAKLVGGGDVTAPLKIIGIRATASVKDAVEKAGGTFLTANAKIQNPNSKQKMKK